MKVILHFRKKSYMRGKFDQKFFLKMEVLKKHLETYVKKFWRLRETEIRSKPLYQKGGSTPKTVIWNILNLPLPNTSRTNTVLECAWKIRKKNFELFYKSPLLLALDMLY